MRIDYYEFVDHKKWPRKWHLVTLVDKKEFCDLVKLNLKRNPSRDLLSFDFKGYFNCLKTVPCKE